MEGFDINIDFDFSNFGSSFFINNVYFGEFDEFVFLGEGYLVFGMLIILEDEDGVSFS